MVKDRCVFESKSREVRAKPDRGVDDGRDRGRSDDGDQNSSGCGAIHFHLCGDVLACSRTHRECEDGR